MKKKTLGIVFLILAVVFLLLGIISRSLFYGITDAPYSVYGKYWTFMICFLVAGGISCIAGILCLTVGKRKKKSEK